MCLLDRVDEVVIMSNYKLICITCTLYNPCSAPCPFVTALIDCVSELT